MIPSIETIEQSKCWPTPRARDWGKDRKHWWNMFDSILAGLPTIITTHWSLIKGYRYQSDRLSFIINWRWTHSIMVYVNWGATVDHATGTETVTYHLVEITEIRESYDPATPLSNLTSTLIAGNIEQTSWRVHNLRILRFPFETRPVFSSMETSRKRANGCNHGFTDMFPWAIGSDHLVVLSYQFEKFIRQEPTCARFKDNFIVPTPNPHPSLPAMETSERWAIGKLVYGHIHGFHEY